MLDKLFKYEFKALFRTLLPMYAGLIVIALINRAALFFSPAANHSVYSPAYPFFSAISTSLTIIYVVSIIALFCCTSLFIVVRFYKNLLTNEGYLSFSLPVTTANHIFVKLTCGFVMFLLSIVTVLLSLFTFGVGTPEMSMFFKWIGRTITDIISFIGVLNFQLLSVEIVVLFLLGIINGLLMIYASIALGQLFGKNRIVGAFLAYFAIYIIIQVFSSTLALVFSCFAEELAEKMMTHTAPMLHFFCLSYILATCIGSVIYYIITRYILTKRLNLE